MLESVLFELQVLGLGIHGWLTLAVVACATLLMAFEKLGPDLVMFSAVCVLVVAGVITPEQGLVGFSRPETVTIGVLFVVAAAVQETGALSRMAQWLAQGGKKPGGVLLRLTAPTALLSGFLNNTPIVAMMIPMVHAAAKRLGQSPGRYLMPLSFAAMLGGTCTLIGTSTNLVVSGLLEESGHAPFGMFELTWVGLPTAVIGLIYLGTVGQWLLPDRADPLTSARDEAKQYLAELQVSPDSPMIGQTVEAAGLRQLPGLFLAEIRRRGGKRINPVAREDRLVAGDKLVFTGMAETIKDVARLPGLIATGTSPSPDQGMFEVVISHDSGLLGRSVRAVEFRRRFGAAILAVHRAGGRVASKIGDIVFQPGDTLMLVASPGFRRTFQHSKHFYMVSRVPHEGQPRYQKAPLAFAALALMVLVPAFSNLSMMVSSMAALLVLLATQCVTPRAAREAVNWPVLMLTGAAFGLSNALEASGAAARIAELVLATAGSLGPYALLTSVYLLGALFSAFISNAAAAALVFPVALSVAGSAGLDPRPFAVALALAASAAFATPIGYQTNLLVYGPGGYRYLDFTRVGAPLNLICLVIALLIVPMVWPL